MDYEKDYDFPFGNFSIAALASNRHREVVSFSSLVFFGANRIAESLPTSSLGTFVDWIVVNSSN